MTPVALRILAIAVLAIPLAAQRTWIVDQNNGPNTDFTDLPPALAAASNGTQLGAAFVRMYGGRLTPADVPGRRWFGLDPAEASRISQGSGACRFRCLRSDPT